MYIFLVFIFPKVTVTLCRPGTFSVCELNDLALTSVLAVKVNLMTLLCWIIWKDSIHIKSPCRFNLNKCKYIYLYVFYLFISDTVHYTTLWAIWHFAHLWFIVYWNLDLGHVFPTSIAFVYECDFNYTLLG